jgi:acetylornithine deacetylase
MTRLSSVQLLERLVGFPTVSRDSNLPLIDWVRNFLQDCGIDSHLVADPSGRKSNLIASLGPLEKGGLVLSGHTDTVPVDGQDWSSDPFKLTCKGSSLYARGACDMKGFIAVALSRVATLRACDLSRPVHLMLSYDEEVGCLGTASLLAAAQELLPEPAAVIVGEPTSLQVANEHKGICVLRTRVTGTEAHSSLTHQGVSAVMLAAELIAHLGQQSRNLATRSLEAHSRLQPPYTSLSVNRIQGGTAINILAAACEFEWDIRTLPGERAESILDALAAFGDVRVAELLKEGKAAAIETLIQADVPGLKADDGPAEALTRAAAPSSAQSIAVPFATEAGYFQRAGWSAVICGPGSIEQAHKPNEFIERSELLACEELLDRAIKRQCC